MPQLRYAQTRYLSVLLLSWLLVFFLTRTVLLLAHLADADAGLFDVLRLYGIGLVYDLSFLLYAALPPALYVLLCPKRLWRSKGHTLFLHVLTGLALFAMLFVAVAEWLFWDEFGVRFNFIAVDYLVYSDEVINNILESYPIYPVLAFLVLLAMAATVGLRPTLKRALAAPLLQKSAALLYVGALAVTAFAVSAVIGQNFPLAMGGNVFQRELASNGPFQFFAAFRNNELDYQQFYATLPDPRAAALLRAELSEPVARFVGSDPLDIRRAIDNPGLEQRRNLVLVTIESLSAKYLGSFGDRRGLTPNLDALRDQSLFFSNFYATGTRTDRGLEAITLSIPPTPGRSIVKRIGRECMKRLHHGARQGRAAADGRTNVG